MGLNRANSLPHAHAYTQGQYHRLSPPLPNRLPRAIPPTATPNKQVDGVPVVVKVYLHSHANDPAASPSDAAGALAVHAERLTHIRRRLCSPPGKCPNLLPFQRWAEAEVRGRDGVGDGWDRSTLVLSSTFIQIQTTNPLCNNNSAPPQRAGGARRPRVGG